MIEKFSSSEIIILNKISRFEAINTNVSKRFRFDKFALCEFFGRWKGFEKFWSFL